MVKNESRALDKKVIVRPGRAMVGRTRAEVMEMARIIHFMCDSLCPSKRDLFKP